MDPKLIALAGPLQGAFFLLSEGERISVGRDPSNVLPIDDASVADCHCVLHGDADEFRICDLDSGSGTFVNGVPVKNRALCHGDQIRIGNSLLLFLIEEREVPYPQDGRCRVQYSAEFSIEHSMVGESARMRRVYDFIAKVAPTESTVLICGESGTGKELAARAIHLNSPRRTKPFVAINCAALTPTLLESELFGHEKGSFTGAIAQKRGRLEVADGGAVFLDEIGELDQTLQAKLLRVLQEREFERVGGTRPIKVDIRLIAATNKNLREAVEAGEFRRDLYYRLNVVSMRMPPLRERREDIPLLSNYFVSKHNRNSRRNVIGLSAEARAAMLNYDWPGNVRELENAIERAVVLGSDDLILPEDLPETILDAGPVGDLASTRFHDAVREAKRQLILKAVEQANGNYTEAAKSLGLHPNYLHRLIRNLDLKKQLCTASGK